MRRFQLQRRRVGSRGLKNNSPEWYPSTGNKTKQREPGSLRIECLGVKYDNVCLFTRYLNFRPIFPPVAVTLSQCIRCDGGRESSAGSETGWRFKLSFTRDVGGSSALGSGISNFDQGIREKLCKCPTQSNWRVEIKISIFFSNKLNYLKGGNNQ